MKNNNVKSLLLVVMFCFIGANNLSAKEKKCSVTFQGIYIYQKYNKPKGIRSDKIVFYDDILLNKNLHKFCMENFYKDKQKSALKISKGFFGKGYMSKLNQCNSFKHDYIDEQYVLELEYGANLEKDFDGYKEIKDTSSIESIKYIEFFESNHTKNKELFCHGSLDSGRNKIGYVMETDFFLKALDQNNDNYRSSNSQACIYENNTYFTSAQSNFAIEEKYVNVRHFGSFDYVTLKKPTTYFIIEDIIKKTEDEIVDSMCSQTTHRRDLTEATFIKLKPIYWNEEAKEFSLE